MHFFWEGDMPHYSPPLPFRRACWPARMDARRGGRGRARWLACPGPRPGSRKGTCALAGRPLAGALRLSARPRTHLAVTAPRFSPVCAPLLAEFFHFLTRYISLAQNIGYVTIKPMTKYCLVFRLSLAGVQQNRNSGLTVLRSEKNRSSDNVQKGQNFGLTLNIGPAYSDRFQVLTAI